MMFLPLQSCVGGLFIGAACGVSMILSGRVAGNSGALKAAVIGPRERSKMAFLGGLASAGVIMWRLRPGLFERAPEPSLGLAISGLLIGFGTSLGNGCTSGHGLCGISRLSLRSLVAVPTFMAVAIATATIRAGASFGPPIPIGATPGAVLELASKIGLSLAAALPLVVVTEGGMRELVVGLWSGACFGVGLSFGGMVRPSVVTGALSPAAFDGTLWTLFVTALATTFALYRIAQSSGVAEASAARDGAGVDVRLVGGAVAFGIGWGSCGICPGPHIVALAADPAGSPGLLLLLAGVALGMRAAEAFGSCRQHVTPVSNLSTADDLRATMKIAGSAIVDLRGLESAKGDNAFIALHGAISAPWDRSSKTMPTAALPANKSTPLIVHCESGRRASDAKAFLISRGYKTVLNAGGPAAPLWHDFGIEHGLNHAHDLGVFVQLFDGPAPASGGGSSTYTYLLGDPASGEAILIDPVLEQVDRDLAAVSQLGLRLAYALNTHCHADHITGSGELKRRVPGARSVISAASTAKADETFSETFTWAGGERTLRVLPTPGHTNGCVSLYDPKLGAVFTGDALLIGGCGRTDFQGGSAALLYKSVHDKLFTLPSDTLVLPAHDYKGRAYSSIAAESAGNPRLTKSLREFVDQMANLNLPYPKKLDVALPANLQCGG